MSMIELLSRKSGDHVHACSETCKCVSMYSSVCKLKGSKGDSPNYHWPMLDIPNQVAYNNCINELGNSRAFRDHLSYWCVPN